MAERHFDLNHRASGVLCHISSLPGPWGNGDLGPTARAFSAWLGRAGQVWWQMLPIQPSGGAFSPYQALSAFAGDPLLISLEELMAQGRLKPKDLKAPHALRDEACDFVASAEFRLPRLRKAHSHFCRRRDELEEKAWRAFQEAEGGWLRDWALYAALKAEQDGRCWAEWPEALRDRHPQVLTETRKRLAREIDFHEWCQFVFQTQWQALRQSAREVGVGLIGDLPIFVAYDSADVWASRELFELDELGQPLRVAGVPPDYFSAEGQRWGNPLYRWETHRHSGWSWWAARFERVLRLFDAIRVDHFIGFHRAWEIPIETEGAKHGFYAPGPGVEFFDGLIKRLGSLPLIAEDLGVVTPEVVALRQQFGFPGMRVLHFSCGPDSEHQVPAFGQDVVFYTGTHDNDTTLGWLSAPASPEADPQAWSLERQRALEWAPDPDAEPVWRLIALALNTACPLAVTPLQDFLGLGSEARMNTPGTVGKNWIWRAKPGSFSEDLAGRCRKLSERSGRMALAQA